ncbi:anti-sigma factor RsiW [Paenibacillus forsythiae]|uniref:Anti-sigma-W factor RsiW n=1 Tax=Paenibacillus forsythiae TaxID=365616 RepID=A0ABU3H704_9BACL|nr:zf-HC2 domain-containing protein [Paenibacillus forsythiae]MDT3426610.1 anti-sigma factor RsiW [Paenibacillus forsythiae]
MNCAEVMEWMHRYLDHDLSRDESFEMFRHIDDCPACAELFERLSALSGELERLPDVSPPFSLVDSILPKLEAIDREKGAAAVPLAGETDAAPRMSRKASRAKTRRSSSLAGRFGIGAAAAAVILGIAVFNMPEKLPGAQADLMLKSNTGFKENADSAANGSEANSRTEAAQELDSGVAAGSEENSGAGSTDDSALTAPESPSPKSGGQDAEGGGVKSSAPDSAKEAQSDRRGDQAASPNPGNENRTFSRKMDSPGPSANASAPPEADSGDQGGGLSDSAMSDTTMQAPRDKSMDMGIMGIAPVETPPDAPSWTSPDGQYTATVEDGKLVIYRTAANAPDGRQAVDAIALEGTWVSGEWKEDSRQFTYVTRTDGGEVSGAFTVPRDPAAPSAGPASSSPSASTQE